MVSVDLRDLVAGVVVALVGGTFFLVAQGLPSAAPGQVGPAFVPSAVGLIAVGLGVAISLNAFRHSGPFPRPALRPALAVFAAVAVFGLLIRSTGLAPALIATTAVAAIGSRKSRPLSVAALAVSVAVGCWLIFVFALGLPFDAIRNPFR